MDFERRILDKISYEADGSDIPDRQIVCFIAFFFFCKLLQKQTPSTYQGIVSYSKYNKRVYEFRNVTFHFMLE
jgi:hypothetical protein